VTESNLITAGLNQKQIEAVTSNSPATLVIAGAGSGKTSVLTRKVAQLIQTGSVPGQILCLTFTNKAAREMNNRVDKLLVSIGQNLPKVPPWQNDYNLNPLLCTFHSLGVRILREFGDSIGLSKNFSILDIDDQKKIIRDILKEMNVDQKNLQPSLISYFISKCKQELLLSKDSRKLSQEYLPVFHQVYAKYEEKLKQNQVVDFDDLILLNFVLLENYPEVREVLQDRWKHILVDEFQDTNPAQFRIIELLAPEQMLDGTSRSLFVVGDDAQSIYGFRGSKVEIILNFHKQYSDVQEIILNQNYRSTQPILDLAEKVLSHNPKQKKKELFTENPDKLGVKYYLAKNEQDESEYIIRQLYQQYVQKPEEEKVDGDLSLEVEDYFDEPTHFIKKEPVQKANDPVSSMFDVYLETEDFKPTTFSTYQTQSWNLPKADWSNLPKLNDCVVLYRTHSQSRSLEETFLKNGLPYRLVSGTRFLDRKEIKDVLSLLKFLINSEDIISFSRFLPLVLDGVGPKTLQNIIAYLDTNDVQLTPRIQAQVDSFLSAITEAWEGQTNLIDFTKNLLSVSGYNNYLKKEYPNKDERETRLENIGELYSLMYPFDQENDRDLPTRLTEFLAQVSLMSQADNDLDGTQPKINLMSLHQSKGLEFESVFLVGVEDGILPHQNSLFEPNGMEEEVRLAYVGVTRAKKYLHLIAADSRIQFGQVKANPVSRIFRPFLDKYCQRVR
jgi:DNA helicase-2/ATP-dependent DNA helicase PcrA